MSERLVSWGRSYDQSLPHSSDSHCPIGDCIWQLINHESRFGAFQHVVGFSTDAPTSGRADRIGAFIVECPSCFAVYYFHCTMRQVAVCKQVGKWPQDLI